LISSDALHDDMTLIASADPGKDAFKVYTFFPTSGTREQALEFCNRFNLRLVVVRAQVRDTPDSDGQWTVVFDYESLDSRASHEHDARHALGETTRGRSAALP
jgi:hypothetical protein